MFIMLFNAGAGKVANIGKNVNYFAKFVSIISPVRYGSEMLMNRIMNDKPFGKPILT